ncbi:hypothetical protein C8J56DRAFT_1063698 [Mycena floridula]|nr:hypothetical protein C8J56DRAFT_1063698 [Mycena floridula]
MPKLIGSMVDPRDVRGSPEKYVEDMKYDSVPFNLRKDDGTVPDDYRFPENLNKNQAFFVVSKLFEEYSIHIGYNTLPTFRVIAVTLFNLAFVPPIAFSPDQRAEYNTRMTLLIITTLRAYSRWRIEELQFRLIRRRQMYCLDRLAPGLKALMRRDTPSMETVSAMLATEDRLADEDAISDAKKMLAIEDAKIEMEAEIRSQYESSDGDSIISSDGEEEKEVGGSGVSDGENQVEALAYPSDEEPVPSSQPEEVELEMPRFPKRTRKAPVRYSPVWGSPKKISPRRY